MIGLCMINNVNDIYIYIYISCLVCLDENS